MKQIIKACLRNVIRACKRYGVSYTEILNELINEQTQKKKTGRHSSVA